MNPSNQSLESAPGEGKSVATDTTPTDRENPMQEYYQLQQNLLLGTMACAGIIFIPVWLTLSLKIALSYLLGACVGAVYLKMLAKDVELVGTSQQRLGTKGLGLFAVLIIVAAKWQQLQILPVFLGFLTYKVAIVIYMVQTALPDKKGN